MNINLILVIQQAVRSFVFPLHNPSFHFTVQFLSPSVLLVGDYSGFYSSPPYRPRNLWKSVDGEAVAQLRVERSRSRITATDPKALNPRTSAATPS